ncbi:MAG: hypothetical protein JNN20_08515 [Betaproteobacteria bacterium]|nr:hypothetical protein [Betaproteobacteria bacterium]
MKIFPSLHQSVVGAVALSFVMLLGACGGDTKTGSNGTGSVPQQTSDPFTASGTLNSSGPVSIGSLSISDLIALIQLNTQLGRSPTELRLGMQAEISGSISSGGNAILIVTNANSITAQSAAVGPVSTINPATSQFTMLSLTVQMDQNTIFEGLPSLAALRTGDRVEVYGLPQPAPSSILATRLILLPANSSAPVELLGNVSNLGTSQFSLQGIQVAAGNAQVSIGGVQALPGAPLVSVGLNGRVRAVGTYDPASNTLVATQVVGGLTPVRNDNSILVLEGLVQSVTTPGRFRLSDADVDATAVGGASAIVGSRVEVRGRKLAGVLVASEYRLITPGERTIFTIQGDITDFASIAAFRVRGESLSANGATFTGGTAADLANGKRVRIRAVAGAGVLNAMEVAFVAP